jgi:hypothetical protein
MQKKIKIFNFYRKFDDLTPGAGDTLYGNYLFYPLYALLRKIEPSGFIWTKGNDFDIAIFMDLDNDLFNKALSLPKEIKKILVLVESVIYAPFAHIKDILLSPVWDAVLSYNREYESKKIFYYEIPVSGIQCNLPEMCDLKMSEYKGVFIGSYKNDVRGNTARRDILLKQLCNSNEISIYGSNWSQSQNYYGKTDNKIRTISCYYYNIAIENANYSGYVTEKIPDAILAERPSIYYGDEETAQKRFPNTFVAMNDLSYKSFQEAKEILLSKYDFYYRNCLREKKQSAKWINSYINTLSMCITKAI